MKKNFLFTCALFLVAGMLFWACGDDDDGSCNLSDITYTNSISTILETNCGDANNACHGSNSSNGSLATYDDAVAFVGFGRTVGAINHTSGFSPMPYPQGTAKLEQCDIDKIENWISNGTPQ